MTVESAENASMAVLLSDTCSTCRALPLVVKQCVMRRWRLVFRVFALGVVGLGVIIGVVTSGPAFGKRAIGERRGRIEASPEWRDGKFRNPQEMWNDLVGSLKHACLACARSHAVERRPASADGSKQR